MAFDRVLILPVLLCAVSLGLSGHVYLEQSAFDIRLIASILALFAFSISLFRLKKLASFFALMTLLLSMITIGVSLDHRLPAVPFMSIALLVSFMSFKKYFRTWFSETTLLWMDPIFVAASIGIYVFANLNYNYGWKGWALPVLPMLGVGAISMMDFMYNIGAFKYMKSNKMIHDTGKDAPDFDLVDNEGSRVKLSNFKGSRNVLLMFVRSSWCPSCHIMLRTYNSKREKFQEKNILLFAIGPDTSEVNRQMAMDMGIDYKILSDQSLRTAMAYRVHLPTAVAGKEFADGMALPASFLIDKQGIIRYTSRPDRIGEFLDPAAIFPVLETLN